MKTIIFSLVAFASFATLASAATGTGSTGTGSVPGCKICAPAPSVGGGGPTMAWNYSKSQYELLPQCFPWTWLNLFLAGDISAIYENQRLCREYRSEAFHF